MCDSVHTPPLSPVIDEGRRTQHRGFMTMTCAGVDEVASRETHGPFGGGTCSGFCVLSAKVNQEISMQSSHRKAPSSKSNLDNLSWLLANEDKVLWLRSYPETINVQIVYLISFICPRLICSSAAWR